jgi:hypothetical protein
VVDYEPQKPIQTSNLACADGSNAVNSTAISYTANSKRGTGGSKR